MFRALAVLSAAVWLALAPAPVDAAASSHKAKAHAAAGQKAAKSKNGHATRQASRDEAPSHKARLRRGADPGVAPTKARGKASRRRAQAQEADATPAETKRGRYAHKSAAAEDEPPVATKASHHGRIATRKADDTGDAEPRVASRGAARHAYAAVETPTIRRAELQAEGVCEAAKAAKGKGRHRKSSKARAAAYASCVARAHAAARRAAEEEAQRVATWTPTRGPIVYAGPATRGPQPYASLTPGETPDPAQTPPGAVPTGGAVAVATAPQPTAPTGGGGFLGSLFRRRNPATRPTGPAPTLASLIGADEARLKTELGDPDLMRAEGGGALWTYRLPNCALYVFLNRPQPTAPWQVKGAQTGPLKRGQSAPEPDACLKAARP